MAHYAFLDENNIVTEVIVGIDENITQIDTDGSEVGGSSEAWENFYGNLRNQKCKRTSYNNNFRNRFAGVGFSYLEDLDVFIEEQPYPSWTKNADTYQWSAPTPMPVVEGKRYNWDEPSLSWVEITGA